jgi:hypothetical protein
VRGPGGEERLLKNARDLCAAAAVLAANYRALEQVAHAGRDELSAKLAVDLRAESDDVLSECFPVLDRLAAPVITGEVGGEPAYQLRRIGAVQMLRLPQLRESMYRLRGEAAGALRQGRRGAMRMEARTLIPDYQTLSAEEIRDRLTRLTQAELATIEAYERTTRNRVAVLEAIAELRGREPWPGYDDMNVTEIRGRLRDADPGQLGAVLDYERAHRNRASILDAPEAHGVS